MPFKPQIKEVKIDTNEEGELGDDDLDKADEASSMQTSESVAATDMSALDEYIQLNKQKTECILLTVTNLSAQPIKVGSHYNFIEANKMLQFDRSSAFGMRLVS